jgi:hypothetical protein
MVKALENMGIVPLQFRLDGNRPDLQKLDSLLGLLATESSSFSTQINELASQIREKGLSQVLRDIVETPDVEMSAVTTTTTTTTTSDTEMGIEANVNIQQEIADFVARERENAEKRSKEKGKLEEKETIVAEKKEEKMCVVCEERPVAMVLLECGHLILCEVCAPPIVEKNCCPLCRAPVVRAVRIYTNV